ncbi:MAG: alanine racemase [Oscillospiraceae bacterium]|nr:alanine racemase [Oscillospiraceae bacterium]MBQ8868375.1 alanine racemase [Oscillospiraceae bacterium]
MLCQTTAYIDLKSIEHNTAIVRSRLKPETKIMAAVKAEAYGHGLAAVSNKLYSLGVKSFAVACLDEALSLRRCLSDCEILILGFTHPSQAAILSENRISQAIYSEEFALALSNYCQKNGVSVTAHLAFDTGMGRIGFTDVDAAIRASKLSGISVEGAFTHFSRADMTDDESIEYTKNQYKKFSDIVSKLKKEIKTPLVCHCANSAGVFRYPEFQMDMIRAGIVLYGLAPNPEDKETYKDIKPAMQLKTVISHVKTVKAGDSISYGGTFVADKEMRIATVPCGYADGYLRSFGAGYALICGKKAKIVGRVCMDQMMLDVTDIPEAELLCKVTLMGKSGDEVISADDLARLDESINYQVVCGVTKRVVRVYE